MSTTTKSKELVLIEADPIGQQLLTQQAAFIRMLGGQAEAEKFIQEAFSAINANPFLRQCTPESLFGALYFAAQIGLPVGGPLQQFHLTPRGIWNGKLKEKIWTVVPVIGYNGLITLAMNTGEYDAVEGKLVYANDDFEAPYDDESGTHFKLRQAKGDRGALIGVIGRALVKGSDRSLIEYLTVEEVRERHRPKEWEKTPWAKDEAQMVKKTGVRRVSKYTAKSRNSWKFALALEADQAVVTAVEGTDELSIEHTSAASEDWASIIRATDDKADLEKIYHRLGRSGELTDDLAALVGAHSATLTKDSRPDRPSPAEVEAAGAGRELTDEDYARIQRDEAAKAFNDSDAA
jgi:recombination protein RecT